MNLSRASNPPKKGFNWAAALILKNWIKFKVEPTIFEPPLKYKPRLKSPQKRFQLSAGFNLEKLNKILSGTNHIMSRLSNLSRGSKSLISASCLFFNYFFHTFSFILSIFFVLLVFFLIFFVLFLILRVLFLVFLVQRSGTNLFLRISI